MATRDEVRKFLAQGRKQAEIAKLLGISPGRVSQIVKELRAAGAATEPAPKTETKAARKWKSKPPPGPNRGSFRPGGPRAGAPKGNKNAVTTGEYETIFDDVLDPEERRLFRTMDTVPELGRAVLFAAGISKRTRCYETEP